MLIVFSGKPVEFNAAWSPNEVPLVLNPNDCTWVKHYNETKY